MLNKNLPSGGIGLLPTIKLKDGDQVEGIILDGQELMTKFGKAFKFTFMIGNTKKLLITKSEYLTSQLNVANPGDKVFILRTGIGSQTRWKVEITSQKEEK